MNIRICCLSPVQEGQTNLEGEMHMREPINPYKVLDKKSSRKRTAVVPVCKLKTNIKTNPRQIGCDCEHQDTWAMMLYVLW